MTASLRTTTNYAINLTPGQMVVGKDTTPWPLVRLSLGNGHEITGNRVEDFQALKEAAEKAIALFEVPV